MTKAASNVPVFKKKYMNMNINTCLPVLIKTDTDTKKYKGALGPNLFSKVAQLERCQ